MRKRATVGQDPRTRGPSRGAGGAGRGQRGALRGARQAGGSKDTSCE